MSRRFKSYSFNIVSTKKYLDTFYVLGRTPPPLGGKESEKFCSPGTPGRSPGAENRGFSPENPSKSRFSTHLSWFSDFENMKKWSPGNSGVKKCWNNAFETSKLTLQVSFALLCQTRFSQKFVQLFRVQFMVLPDVMVFPDHMIQHLLFGSRSRAITVVRWFSRI